MANDAYYLVKFHTDCEECGRRFEGVFWRKVPDGSVSPLSGVMTSGMLEAAEYVDARNTKKSLESRLREHRWSDLSSGGNLGGVSYTAPHTHFCPHCGARQSWDPMTEPRKPEKESGRIGYVLISAFFCGIVGMLIGLFAMIALGTVAFVVCSLLGVVLGGVFGWSIGGSINKEELESYNDRLAAYEKEKADYDAFQQKLKTRTVHNEPVPEFETGCFGPEIPFAADIGKFHPDACPHCGRKLEGKVRVGSTEAARVSAGCCPWCGKKLPANRQIRFE